MTAAESLRVSLVRTAVIDRRYSAAIEFLTLLLAGLVAFSLGGNLAFHIISPIQSALRPVVLAGLSGRSQRAGAAALRAAGSRCRTRRRRCRFPLFLHHYGSDNSDGNDKTDKRAHAS